MTRAESGKSPAPLRQPQFLLGRNSRGAWVVRDQEGTRGGLFIDRKAALDFVRFQNGGRPHAVVVVPDVFELDIAGNGPGRFAAGAQAASA